MALLIWLDTGTPPLGAPSGAVHAPPVACFETIGSQTLPPISLKIPSTLSPVFAEQWYDFMLYCWQSAWICASVIANSSLRSDLLQASTPGTLPQHSKTPFSHSGTLASVSARVMSHTTMT